MPPIIGNWIPLLAGAQEESDFADGTVTDPSIGFTDDSDTGFYSPANGQIAATLNGAQRVLLSGGEANIDELDSRTASYISYSSRVANANSALAHVFDTKDALSNADAKLLSVRNAGNEKFYVSAGGGVYISAGTARSPGLAFIGDADTGIFRNSEGSIALSTDGVIMAEFRNDNRWLFYDLNGTNIGLFGEETSDNTMRIQGVNGRRAAMVGAQADSTTSIGCITTTTTNYALTGSKLLSVQNNGNEKFYISAGGGVYISNGTAARPALAFITDEGTGIWTAGSGEIDFATNGTTRMSITSRILASEMRARVSGDQLSFGGFVTDGASAVNIVLNSQNSLDTAGAKQLSIRNNNTEVFYISGGGGLYAADGNGSIPGISYVNDPDTGFTRNAANTIEVRCGGIGAGIFTAGNLREDQFSADGPNAVTLSGRDGDDLNAVGVVLNNLTTLTNKNAVLVSIMNNSTVKAEFSTDGALRLTSGAAAAPAASATHRGRLWISEGGAGVADTFWVCKKNTSNTYEWQQVTTSL